MEPQPSVAEQPSKIFINPKFAKAHINPMFLASNGTLRRPEVKQDETTHHSSSIHLNPAFLDKLRIQQVSPPTIVTTAPSAISQPIVVQKALMAKGKVPATVASNKPAFTGTVNPIITNTRRKLVRATTTASESQRTVVAKPIGSAALPVSNSHQLAPLIRIGKNKLIRSATPITENVKPRVLTIANTLPERKSLRIDRRVATTSRSSMQKLTFVKQYALSRINGITPKKVVITDPKLLKLKRNPMVKSDEKSRPGKSSIAYASKNKQLVLVNINGVLYRSSTNKLQKSVARSPPALDHSPVKPARKTKERYLIIRGMRFALDRNGMKLRSVGNGTVNTAAASRITTEPRLNRIDIGGLTYKARKDGIFIRTDNHKTRNHLSVAKQRSIQVLASKLRKCNEPCHIYRRLGKCLAHQRGKCPKVHDPKHVSICQKFLRGECILDGCFLSHDVSLEKMPVCTFFLEGRCTRDVCPYLHKKVSEKERICDAFLNGFCSLADKCPNRHVFQCPEFEQNGKCDRIRCPYPHGKKEVKSAKSDSPSPSTAVRKPERQEQPKPKQTPPTMTSPIRYYKDDGQSMTINRDQTGEFSASERNQLKRMLGEVEKMKQRYKEDINTPPTERTVDNDGQIVSIESNPTSDGDCSEASKTLSEPTPDDAKNDNETEEDTRPAVFRRKALGTLPAFIPI
ncbi:zinc finger CCCH domain-containing protein 3 [Anopheles moucheti]|uniref:zinc finger CCCH domain-containing protein 3 n=1 Tax=Anopheles moucheti TaxID=186751 RepID=UPI0022F08244|nr:zinc finger CCCH domain-containing protein 3 [Anopheles moucheti]